MTGYLLSLNGGPIAWKAARQGGVTLSSSEAEFIAASQAGKEVLYLRALLKGFACPQTKPTETWEDNDFCILMSENPTNRERSRASLSEHLGLTSLSPRSSRAADSRTPPVTGAACPSPQEKVSHGTAPRCLGSG